MNPRRNIRGRESWDAIIVGARCAGAATALLLARAGLRVLVLERGRPGSDTVSTHALMRGGVLQLARWGLLGRIQAAGTPPVRSTTFHYEDDALTVAIKPRDGVDALYAPRRTVLDPLLASAAQEAGAEFRYGAPVLDLQRDADGRVRGVVSRGPDSGFRHLAADLVIGADGLRSSVAALAGAPVLHEARHATGVVFGYFAGLPADGYHWHFRPGVSAGVIPTNGGLSCVFVSLPAARLRHEMAHGVEALFRCGLAEVAPAVAQALTAAPRAGTLRIFPGTPGFMRRPHGPGWALVGDAGYFRDPLTAHGITDALRDAELLTEAVLGGGSAAAFANYQSERDALSRGLFEVTDEIAGFGWNLPRLRELHDRLSDEMSRGVRALAARRPAAQVA